MSDRKPSPHGGRYEPPGYLRATLHPWPCLLFVLPLLALYEAGVWGLGGSVSLRNGADAWLRWGLAECGLRWGHIAPVALVVLLAVRAAWRYGDAPDRLVAPLLGMLLESLLFAVALWGVGRCIGPVFAAAGPRESFGQALTYLGAGVYEEAIFRLVLFAGLATLLRLTEVPAVVAVGLAAVASSVLFAAAHHIGPYGEPICADVFVFRALAGLYFAALYQFRGFGVAVGAHAAYDLLVGLSLG